MRIFPPSCCLFSSAIFNLCGFGFWVLALISTQHPKPFYSSSTCLPRRRATSNGSFMLRRPSKVARTTLCGLPEPSTLVRTSWTPAACMTARTAPPAMTPVPSLAGFIRTRPAPWRPMMGCGSVLPMSGTRIRLFFAASIAFLMATGTSRALPVPKPTWPAPSPITTSAANERFLPPLTTFVTRFIEMTWSVRSSPCAGILCLGCRIAHLSETTSGRGLFAALGGLVFAFALVLVEARLARRVGQGLDAPVEAEAAAVEDDLLDARRNRALGDGAADALRGLYVAARARAQVLLHGRGRGDGHGALVVDDLRVDVVEAAEYREARALLASAHAAAYARVNRAPDRCFVSLCHFLFAPFSRRACRRSTASE